MSSIKSRILILCKTYPSPSGRHTETSCVAGIRENGQLIRLFPVPFRFISDDKQFKKWQWISARIEKAPNDHRPESHRLFVDTIEIEGDPLPPRNGWKARLPYLNKLKIYDDFTALENARKEDGITLGLLRPSRILGLDITPSAKPNWTDAEKQKLLQSQRQAGLFDDSDAKSITTLKKIPFDFHYRYACSIGNETSEYRHKVADWEAGALYWNCRRTDKNDWEEKFRDKLEYSLPKSDFIFLMGTIHRLPDQWMIVSLIYPPKPPIDASNQGSLFDL